MRAEILRPPPGVARVSLGEVRRHPVELGVCVAVLGLVLVGIATTRHTAPSAVESVLTRFPLAEPAPLLTGAAATRFCALLLNQAQQKLDDVRTIRAVLHTRDRVAELAVIDLKVRRDPMSVHIRWQDPKRGRELVWQENARGGWIGVGRDGDDTAGATIPFDPASDSAREFAPRPVTEIGLWALNERLLSYVKGLEESTDCQMTDGVRIDGHECWMFRFMARPPGAARKYETARLCIDRSLELPVAAEFHDRASRGQPAIVDSWAVTGLKLNPKLGDEDFRLRDAAGQETAVTLP